MVFGLIVRCEMGGQSNERTAGWVDIDKPNRWELLSLIIDTPVSKEEHKRIVDGMSGIEKLGIKMVRQITPFWSKIHHL